MKIEKQYRPPEFVPVVITLQTQEEVQRMYKIAIKGYSDSTEGSSAEAFCEQLKDVLLKNHGAKA